ncbi:hypothetical protein [Escherichia coli]|uniref:hypothetical protein n=1 Tax=Escherichia coli TaxID=562 RepID=UPI00201A4E69|nr:hypothetical protein [Escherichia coli]
MNIITVPKDTALYPGLAVSANRDIRMKLGMSRIYLNYREILNQRVPVLVIDCFNARGKLYTLRYNLPPDTPERTERRISLLLHLLRKQLDVACDAA